MRATRLLPVSIAVFLCSCTTVDGFYTPSCVAYEGSEIELSADRFTWRRFTDERKLDEHGQPLEPFPGFPKTGRYEEHGSRIDLIPEDGSPVVRLHVKVESKETYLLTDAENDGLLEDGKMPECALRRTRQLSRK